MHHHRSSRRSIIKSTFWAREKLRNSLELLFLRVFLEIKNQWKYFRTAGVAVFCLEFRILCLWIDKIYCFGRTWIFCSMYYTKLKMVSLSALKSTKRILWNTTLFLSHKLVLKVILMIVIFLQSKKLAHNNNVRKAERCKKVHWKGPVKNYLYCRKTRSSFRSPIDIAKVA